MTNYVLGTVAILAGVTFAPPAEVEKQGQTSATKLQHAIAGPLTALNGKYDIRASEVRYAPGGFIGEHLHAGPGIRCLTSGELTYIQPDKTTVYKAGDCFFESGEQSHRAENRGTEPVVLLNFEVLPAGWSGATAIPVPK